MAVNGNKSLPQSSFTSNFTRRLALHPLVAYYPYPSPFCGALVSFMIDQLLVSKRAANMKPVSDALDAVGAHFAGNVFDETQAMPSEQVQIWVLDDTSGSKPHADVAEAVWTVRAVAVGLGCERGEVAPNHVLIPAPNYHDCPWGPPEEHAEIGVQAREPGDVTVAVIDSGYQPQGPAAPAADGIVTRAAYGDWLQPYIDDTDGLKKYRWEKGSPAPNGVDPFDQNGDGFLDALVGHANFIAGIMAQLCQFGELVVESHNGAFVEADDTDPAIPTEASVARSLWNQRDANVIHVGFAFPTLPDLAVAKLADGTGPPSWSMQVVLESFVDRPDHWVVAPAGNQSCWVPQYPAAFSTSEANVVGVGSVNDSAEPSTFSNHGPWVSCCTEGEDVVSTFIDGWSGPTEEDEPVGRAAAGTKPDKSFNGYAAWSGTSFAAPKITGVLAALHADHKSLPDAWAAMTTGAPVTADMGFFINIPMPVFVP